MLLCFDDEEGDCVACLEGCSQGQGKAVGLGVRRLEENDWFAVVGYLIVIVDFLGVQLTHVSLLLWVGRVIVFRSVNELSVVGVYVPHHRLRHLQSLEKVMELASSDAKRVISGSGVAP